MEQKKQQKKEMKINYIIAAIALCSGLTIILLSSSKLLGIAVTISSVLPIYSELIIWLKKSFTEEKPKEPSHVQSQKAIKNKGDNKQLMAGRDLIYVESSKHTRKNNHK